LLLAEVLDAPLRHRHSMLQCVGVNNRKALHGSAVNPRSVLTQQVCGASCHTWGWPCGHESACAWRAAQYVAHAAIGRRISMRDGMAGARRRWNFIPGLRAWHGT
jgi:hypothetical protein